MASLQNRTACGFISGRSIIPVITSTATAPRRRVTRLGQAAPEHMRFYYEAGPRGYGIHRTLTALSEDWVVVAPSP